MILKLYLKAVEYFSQFTLVWTRQLCNVVLGGSLPNDNSFWRHNWWHVSRKEDESCIKGPYGSVDGKNRKRYLDAYPKQKKE